MKTIYKYKIDRFDATTTIELPESAEVLHCAIQYGEYCIWVRLDTDAPRIKRSFTVVGTGWEIEDDMNHISTIQDGAFVWHIFEVPQ